MVGCRKERSFNLVIFFNFFSNSEKLIYIYLNLNYFRVGHTNRNHQIEKKEIKKEINKAINNIEVQEENQDSLVKQKGLANQNNF